MSTVSQEPFRAFISAFVFLACFRISLRRRSKLQRESLVWNLHYRRRRYARRRHPRRAARGEPGAPHRHPATDGPALLGLKKYKFSLTRSHYRFSDGLNEFPSANAGTSRTRALANEHSFHTSEKNSGAKRVRKTVQIGDPFSIITGRSRGSRSKPASC